MLDDQVLIQRRGIPHVLHDGNVNLGVGLQPRVAGELEKIEQSDRKDAGADPEPVYLAGVLSSCCFAHIRLGSSSSDFVNAWRASALRFILRSASPSQR